MYKSILVPLDGSRRAEAILPHVESLALSYKSYVLMLRVIEPGQVIVDPHESMLQLQLEEFKTKEEEARAYLRGHIGEFRERGIKTDLRIAQGPVVKSIIQMAESENVDLVAMASHGRTGLARAFYGSVAAGVLNRINRPLLLVRSIGG